MVDSSQPVSSSYQLPLCAFLAARAKDDGFVARLGGSVTLILPTHRSKPSSAQSCRRVSQMAPDTESKRVEDKQHLAKEKRRWAKVKSHSGVCAYSAEFLCI